MVDRPPPQVGRPGTVIPPGGAIGSAIDKIGSGGQFGKNHDNFVDMATEGGIPDLLINIPSMLPVYLITIGKDIYEMPVENRPNYFPIIEIRF